MHVNELASIVICEAIKIHRELGPGLLESVYEAILYKQLLKRGLRVQRQVPISIQYDGDQYDEGFRVDLIVEGKLIVELKSVEVLMPVHKKQTLTYVRLSNYRLGLLINFGETLVKNGISRLINGSLE
ncbi:GxxExxY protein [Coraliomargarita akajimensis]|uniref:GxxExxY protein n=1 Tax=Coraliomargarita akajimensis (strain DSM 45221 / IAM 15411 / JCM 23193 / KCTC 12865 / 04OKA010-24) TaxID=583355 RepID=D5EIF3_CORAD|nr:GxxExxY protein [Coraliomargarita akajimensis]ADE54219.1 conserved hypothetical protein [Coraliomargarita akajimensis DSM 45221]